MQVVVVVREHLDAAGRPGEPGAGSDEDDLRPFAQEQVDERLRPPPVNLGGEPRRALASIRPWVVDVGVEPVLVARVPDGAEARAEVAAVRAAEVADRDARRAG